MIEEDIINSINADQTTGGQDLTPVFGAGLGLYFFEDQMEIRVAVATNTGFTVDEHFGKASSFTIYQLKNQEWRQVEVRSNVPACHGHSQHDDLLDQTVSLLGDCQGVIASQVGAGALDTLLYRKILPFAISGPIEDALATVLQSKLFRIRYKVK